MSYSKYIVLSVSAIAASVAAVVYWRYKRRNEFRQVGKVTGLYVYPVKSCRGIRLDTAICIDQGLEHDRRWVILNEKNRFITARETPKLALIAPSLTTKNGELESLCLDAPDMETLRVNLPLDSSGEIRNISVFGVVGEGQYAGDKAAAWVSQFLDKPGCQLYYMTKPRHVAHDETWGAIAKPNDKHGFGDLAPVLVTTEEALEALNKELDSNVDMRRFRPNIVVKGTNIFDEDNWKQLKINDIKLRSLISCPRCIMTTVNPDLGVKEGKEPFETLKRTRTFEDKDPRYGKAPIFGKYLAVDEIGTVRVGDTVFATS